MPSRPEPSPDAPRRPARRVLVIANPIAGRGSARERAEALARELDTAGLACELHFTRARGDATTRAAAVEADVDVVVSVGGDGTLCEVLTGLPRRDLDVAVLPMGTANVLSLDLALPRDPTGVARLVRTGRVQRLDTALVNGTLLSFLVSGVGFDAAVVHELDRRRKGPITKLDWCAAAWHAFRTWDGPRLDVEVDGQRIEGEWGQVLVSNIVHYGGFPVLDPTRALDDGRFEVYLFPGRTRRRVVGHLVRGMLRRFPSGPVSMRRARRVVVRADRPAPVQIDGDARGSTPFDLVVGSHPFRLLVP